MPRLGVIITHDCFIYKPCIPPHSIQITSLLVLYSQIPMMMTQLGEVIAHTNMHGLVKLRFRSCHVNTGQIVSMVILLYMISSDIAMAYLTGCDYLAAKSCSSSAHFRCPYFVGLTGHRSKDTLLQSIPTAGAVPPVVVPLVMSAPTTTSILATTLTLRVDVELQHSSWISAQSSMLDY